MKVLVVCLGNICRSPLAEGILKQKIMQRGLDWEIDSAGTGSWHIGEAPDPRSVAVARAHGMDIAGQRARQITEADLRHYDLILTMDESNYHDVLHLTTSEALRQKVALLLPYVGIDAQTSVPDRYWNDDGFEQVYQLLDRATERLLKKYAVNNN